MAKGFKHGPGGSPLNFKVVAYATEELLKAATPKENTIGIITTTPIASWIFSATQPEAVAQGMVWIPTGTSSTNEFNALKKNAIQVYPLGAKQYVNDAWVAVDSYSYKNGEWVYLWNGELFINGNQFEAVTGGWSPEGLSYSNLTNAGAIIDSAIKLSAPAGSKLSAVVTKNLIDLTNISEICANVTAVTSGIHLFATRDKTKLESCDARLQLGATGLNSLSVEGLDGEYYVGLFANSNSSTARGGTVTEVYLK